MLKLAILSFVISLVLTPLIRYVCRQRGWLAYPTKDRWHQKPTALFGGIAIYAGFAVALLFHTNFADMLPHLFKATGPALHTLSFTTIIWLGATFIFILGLFDDITRIKPQTKLVGQILVASMVTFLGFRLHWVTSMTVDTTLTILWIVGITNAFNLIDNMDGLCAGTGLVAAVYAVLLSFNRSPETAIVAILLVGALAAFLIYNFNPASIFMGDCGSMLIGFTLALLTLNYADVDAANRLRAITVPIMILMVPIFDTTLVTLIRTLSGRKASVGGKDHTSHRLVLMGLSEKNAVLFLYGIAAVSGLSALFVDRSDTLTSPAVIIPLVLSFLLLGIYLAQLRIYPEKEFSMLRDKSYTPVLVELTYKRQMLLVFLDFFLIAFAYYLSYRLRFDADEFAHFFKFFLRSLPAVIACKFIAFFTMGIYRGIWRYMSSNDVFVYLKASTLASFLAITFVAFVYRFEGSSKGVLLIDWLLTTGLLIGTRGSFKLFVDTIKRKGLHGDSVIIYGAGRGGEILLREMLNNDRLNLKPIGFIDDDELKTGKKLQGFPILGTFEDLDRIKDKHRPDGLLISFTPKATDKIIPTRQYCRQNGLFLKQFAVTIETVDLEDRTESYPSSE